MSNRGSEQGIDSIRAVASFMVIVLHVAAGGFYDFDGNWFAINLYDSFVRVCVPLFLMVSGVLLLGRQEPLGRFAWRRGRRVVPALLLWSLIYAGVQSGGMPDVVGFARRLVAGPVQYHLWYLYALIGIYAFVPVMRALHLHGSPGDNRLFLAMWALVACIWPAAAAHFGFSYALVDVYWLHSFAGLGVYMLLGAHLRKWLQSGRCWGGLLLFVLSSLAVAWMTYSRAVAAGRPDELFYAYLSPFVLSGSIGAFLFLGAQPDGGGRVAAVVRLISNHSLGIFCVHVLMIDLVRDWGGLSLHSGSAWWSVPVTAIVVFTLSAAASLLIARVPLLRYTV